MKMRPILAVLSLVLALALPLAACSGDGGTGGVPAQSSQPTASPATTPDNGDDSMEGGGAGGTNDLDNDGHPDESLPSPSTGTGGSEGHGDMEGAAPSDGSLSGDLEEGVDDLARGIRRAGDAIGQTAEDMGKSGKDGQ